MLLSPSLYAGELTPPASRTQADKAQAKSINNGVSPKEIEWALQLEQKMNNDNYQPNASEVGRYQNILQQFSAAPKQPSQAEKSIPKTNSNVSQAEIEWARQLEQKVENENYQPNTSEVSRYQNILQQFYAAPKQPPQAEKSIPKANSNVSQAEIEWALQLEQKVKNENYQPNASEVSAYQAIAERLINTKQ
ncbi:hypothetical protein [Parvibium lacunae]|uniref:DUF4148 domain-containing protein n=1 Tax=Parvibium lacunae TaxID=1888893 RepID=A0A368KYL9_9BURK|nr:hypothetical protein [Parvibium lacunae]RCS56528.1 hypothetical protein DU000_11200 [Parvibium lacunae]